MKIHLTLLIPLLLCCHGTLSRADSGKHDLNCDQGAFCDLPGGAYLNAIYRQDRDLIARIDRQYLDEIEGFMRDTSRKFGIGENDPVLGMITNATVKSDQFIVGVANKYLYLFKQWPGTCRKAGARQKTFTEQGPDIVDVDEYGVTHVIMKGDIYEADYITNPEFFALRDQVGSAHGAPASDRLADIEAKRLVYRGIERMQSKYDCAGKAVRDFEKGLLTLTTAAIENKPQLTLKELFAPILDQSAQASGRAATRQSNTAVYAESSDNAASRQKSRSLSADGAAGENSKAVDERKQMRLRRIQAQDQSRALAQSQTGAQAETPAQRLARLQAEAQAQAAARAEASARAQAEAEARVRLQTEVYQQMTSELEVLGRHYQQRMSELTETFRQTMQSAKTNEARTAAQQQYQSEMGKLRQKMQEESAAIRQSAQQRLSADTAASSGNSAAGASTAVDDSAMRRQQMNADLQALGVEYGQRISALGQSFQQQLQKAASAEARNTLLQAYQKQMQQLQQQAQRDSVAIRERYQLQ